MINSVFGLEYFISLFALVLFFAFLYVLMKAWSER